MTPIAWRGSSPRSRCLRTTGAGSRTSRAGSASSTTRSRLERYPTVGVIGGWIHALRGRPGEAERWLAAAERGSSAGTEPDGEASAGPSIALLRAALCRDGVEQMCSDVEQALADLPSSSQWRPLALTAAGIGARPPWTGRARRCDPRRGGGLRGAPGRNGDTHRGDQPALTPRLGARRAHRCGVTLAAGAKPRRDLAARRLYDQRARARRLGTYLASAQPLGPGPLRPDGRAQPDPAPDGRTALAGRPDPPRARAGVRHAAGRRRSRHAALGGAGHPPQASGTGRARDVRRTRCRPRSWRCPRPESARGRA